MGRCFSCQRMTEPSGTPEFRAFNGLEIRASSVPLRSESYAAGSKARWKQSGKSLALPQDYSTCLWLITSLSAWFCFHPTTVLCKIQTLLGKPRTPVAWGRRLFYPAGEEMASCCQWPCDSCCASQVKRPTPRPVPCPWTTQTSLQIGVWKGKRVGQEKLAVSSEHS